MIDMMGHRLEEREVELARITSLSKWSIQRGLLVVLCEHCTRQWTISIMVYAVNLSVSYYMEPA